MTNQQTSRKWRAHDFAIRLISEELKGSPEPICQEDGEVTATVQKAMTIVPCEIDAQIGLDLAMLRLREYILRENPELTGNDFQIEPGWDDHIMTNWPRACDMIYITASGVTTGPPE